MPNSHFLSIKGMFQCRKLNFLTCRHAQHCQKHFTTIDKTYAHNDFYNCSTEFVIYCLSCPCGLLYMGRTIGTIRKRFVEHRWSGEEGADKLSVPKYFLEFHQKSLPGLRVWVRESISKGQPRAERIWCLCARATYWIYTLDTMAPGGLNEDLEVHSVL